MEKKIKALIILLVFSVLFVQQAFAASTGLVPCGLEGKADCTLCHLVVGFKNIYDYLLTLLLSATTLAIVIAGVVYIVSSGSQKVIDKAKQILMYAIVAVIFALLGWLIINVTLNALGFTQAGSWYSFTCDTSQSSSSN